MRQKEKGLWVYVLIIFCCCIVSVKTYSQALSIENSLLRGSPYRHGYYTDGNTLLTSAQFQPDVLPQSPEAEAMAKYTLLPVTLYSGLPQVSIPIFDLKTPGLDVPISLSYNYNGFKPAETASYVGLGWNVQGGGMVMRHIEGQVDHMNPDVIGNDYDNYVNINEMTAKQAILQDMGLNEMDGQPDLYIFNAPGLSGKFIMMQGEAYMFPYQAIHIQTRGEDEGFVITNEKGDQYTFSVAEVSYHKTTQFGEYIPIHASAWFLSQIISADLTDTINYNYTSYTFTQPPNYSELLTVTYNGTTGVTSEAWQETPSQGDYINSQLLSSISSKNATVLFNTSSTPRTDEFLADSAMYPLSNIQVLGTGTALSKNFNLYQAYYGGKLTLTEVDQVVSGIDGVDTSVTNQLTQRYKFQYTSPDTNIYSIPGWNNRSVDYWGYYNGAGNTTLFTRQDFNGLANYADANRTPNFSYCVHSALSKVIYPTGGYDTLIYEQNQSGTYNVTVEPNYTIDTVDKDLIYPYNGTVASVGYSYVFTLYEAQMVHLYYDEGGFNTISPDPVIKIYRGWVGDTLAYAAPQLADSQQYRHDSVYLPAGNYVFIVTCDSAVGEVDGTLNYDNYPIITTNTLAPGPGIRIRQVSSYDNIHVNPVLNKHYTYNNGTGFFQIGAKSSAVTQEGSLCYGLGTGSCPSGIVENNIVTSLQANLNPSVSDFINNQFYYGNVEETDSSNGNNGKTDYAYSCWSETDPNVYLTQRTDYGYVPGEYVGTFIPLKQATTSYQTNSKLSFQTFTSTVVEQGFPNSGCYSCLLVPTPDQTQPIAGVNNVYGPIHGNPLPSGYITVKSKVDIAWDQNGQNPVTNESDYYYDNPSHIFPTRIITHNSKGDQITTQLKYPLDYPVPHTMTRAGQDTSFYLGINYADSMYNNCYDNLLEALDPYQPYASNVTNFTNVCNSYPCESTYATNSSTVFSTRNTLWANYLSSLDSAERADTSSFDKGVYWMQANNVLSPVIEKYVSVLKSDGNEYLLSATRNNYSLFVNGNGDTVAKQTGILETELSSPLLESSFLANIYPNYHNEVAISYDAGIRMASQVKVNDVPYSYLWGYNHQFVVAEVEGASETTIASYVNQSVLDNLSTSPQAMRAQLANIRTGLAGTKALVTTCTYDPLIGITSKTDPAGRTTYYDYDTLGRLMDIKDQDGNVVKTFYYHYYQGH